MKIPEIDINSLSEYINDFKTIDYTQFSIQELMDKLTRIFHGFAIASISFSFPIAIYRSVKWSTRPSELKNLSYPQPDKITSFGRINDKNESYFYGSFNWEPTLYELNLKENDTVAVSMWQTKSNVLICPIGYTEDNFKYLDALRKVPSEVRPYNIPVLMRETNVVVDKLLSQLFSRKVNSEDEYKISIAIAKFLFSNQDFEGILYPTIAMNALSDNIALRTTVVDEKLKFNEARFMKIIKKDDLIFKTEILSIANNTNDDGFLIWQ